MGTKKTESYIRMKNLLIINGPNINLTGKREPDIYGNMTYEDYFNRLVNMFPEINIKTVQTNHEGEIIDLIQKYGFEYDGIILNAGGYTHTSVAIRDAIAAVTSPVVEVHISNIYAREEFRQKSLISPVCKGTICGFGMDSYRLAVEALA